VTDSFDCRFPRHVRAGHFVASFISKDAIGIVEIKIEYWHYLLCG
jgi:hypothetical protein